VGRKVVVGYVLNTGGITHHMVGNPTVAMDPAPADMTAFVRRFKDLLPIL
jgi:hypothetical protein